jgi:hypothetical protein
VQTSIDDRHFSHYRPNVTATVGDGGNIWKWRANLIKGVRQQQKSSGPKLKRGFYFRPDSQLLFSSDYLSDFGQSIESRWLAGVCNRRNGFTCATAAANTP